MPKQVPDEDAETTAKAVAVMFPTVLQRASALAWGARQSACASDPGYCATVGSRDLVTVTCTSR